MPKSKRNKQITLSKTKKHGFEGKKKLYEEIRSCVETYTHLFIFSVNDMRNSKIKNVREQWRHSRFFIGKNKVMAKALGTTPEEEYRMNLHQIGVRLKGERGLFFTNQPIEEVLKWFSSFSEGDFARSGSRATETVILEEEQPLTQFPHSLEPYLRQLGLPTTLKKGIIHLVKNHVVCNVGDILTPETAKIVKLLGYEMAEFYIKMECHWSQDGTFCNLLDGKETEENSKLNNFPASNQESNGAASMDVDDDDEEEVNSANESSDEEEIPEEVIPIKKTGEKETTSAQSSEDEEIPELVEDAKKDSSVKETTAQESSDEEEIPELVKEEIKSSSEKETAVNGSSEKVLNTKNKPITNVDSTTIQNGNSESISTEETVSESATEKTSKPESMKKLSLDKSVLSPIMSEKRPKFSPKMTRSAMKAKKTVSRIDSNETVVNELKNLVESVEAEEGKQKGRATKKQSTGASPAERQLRNRSVKIVKNKK